jgi:hypothetical protein
MASDGLWWPLIASLIRYDLATEAIRLNPRACKCSPRRPLPLPHRYDLATEAIRLNPQKKEYLSNRAAAGLKLGLPSKVMASDDL